MRDAEVNQAARGDPGLAWLGALPWCLGILLPQYYMALFGTGLVVFLLLVAMRWRDALAVIIFLSPLTMLIRASDPSDLLLASFEEVMVASLVCGYVLAPARIRTGRLPAPAVASLVLMMVVIILEGVRSGSFLRAVFAIREHCRYLPLALVVGDSVAQRRVRARDVLWWIAAAGVAVCAFQLFYSFTDWHPFLTDVAHAAKETQETRYVAGWPLQRRVPVTFGGPSALCNVVCPAAVVWFVLAFEKRSGWFLRIATALGLLGTAALTVSSSEIIALWCAGACALCAVLITSLKSTRKKFGLGLAMAVFVGILLLSNIRMGAPMGRGWTVPERVRSDPSVYTRHLTFTNVTTVFSGQGLEVVRGANFRADAWQPYGESLVDSGWSGLLPQMGLPISLWILFTMGLIVWMSVRAAAASLLEPSQGNRRDFTGLAACCGLGACFGSVHVLPWENYAGLDVIFVALMGLAIGFCARQVRVRGRVRPVDFERGDSANPLTPLGHRTPIARPERF
jgi:hypothetical protein